MWKMASNITNRMRSISEVTKAVAMGDLTKRVQVDTQGEMLHLKMAVNSMVNQLSTLADELARVSLQVGTEGILGGQATVPDVQGIGKVCPFQKTSFDRSEVGFSSDPGLDGLRDS
jgi:osomolarity two-component system sensor histidine kinase NIK1